MAIAVFCALFFRLWALQVISGDRYLEDARNNQIRTFRIEAARGTILDRDGEILVSNTAGTLVSLWPPAIADLPPDRRRAMLSRLAGLLNITRGEIEAKLRRYRGDPLTAVTIKTSVHEEKVNYLYEHQGEFPGVSVESTQLRRYEQGGLAAHILGYVGEIDRKELASRRDKGYGLGDRIGKTGIERIYDTYLRGVPGVGQVRVDALGNSTSTREYSQLPEGGHSLRLTLDADLQRATEEALAYGIRLAHETYDSGWASDGGAMVAMDPNTGEILALASSPSFDPSIYVGRIEPKKLARLADPEANSPTLNRAVAGLYPPGSTFKPVTALAALEEGLVSSDELVQCDGQREIDGHVFKNWDPYVNEPMSMTTALGASCDTYFYDLAIRFYERPDSPMQRWARLMGFQKPTGIDVGPEGSGLIPTPEWKRRTFKTEIDKLFKSGDSVQLAIGQGDVLVTPLQMTRFYALVANGGKLVEPQLVRDVEEPRNEGSPPLVLRRFAPKPPQDIGLSPATLRVVQEGLYDATHASYGTATSVFGSFPVEVAGKTGTAEKFMTLPTYQGLLDQSWFCGYGPFARPELVVCALIENGGHGGSAAAPAALKVFEAYFGVKATSVAAEQTD